MIEKEELLKQVSEENLMVYTKNITKEVRTSGSEEEYRAFQYVKDQLDAFGFETRLYKRKGYISYPVSATLKIDGKKYDAITHSMAPSTNAQGVEAEVVYVKDGSEADYTKDVNGKAVIIDGLAIPSAVTIAEKHGAVAAIFINAEYTHEMIVSTVWGNPEDTSGEGYPNIPIVSVNYMDGQKIKNKMEKDSLICKVTTTVHTEWRDIPTLIADYEGEKDPEDYVLFSGHIDSWHYGAMDNGSANATMLEVARVIAENKVPLYRSLRLAFWSGHSHGRYAGSALYADENWEDLHDHCVLHVNIDSVGGNNATVLSEGNSMEETKAIANKSIRSIAGQSFSGTRYGRAGDQSFWGPGVPSLLMGLSEQEKSDTPAMAAFTKLFGGGKGGGFGWWWHTTEDTIDKLDPAFLKRDCQIYLSILLDVCTNAKLPIDQMAAAEEIRGHIASYAEKVPHMDIFLTILRRLDSLLEEITYVEEKFAGMPDEDELIKIYNNWNKRMSKGLVRLNYVKDDPFSHDTASGQLPVPLLANALHIELAKTPHEKFVLETNLLRSANKVNFLLRQLIEVTKKIKKAL